MSHFTVLVPAKTSEQLDALLRRYDEGAMGFDHLSPTERAEWLEWEEDSDAPEGGYWHNPDAKWDWYVIGGRWSGAVLTLTDDATKQGLQRLGNAGLGGRPEENSAPDCTDIAQKKHIDFEAIRQANRLEYMQRHDAYAAAVAEAKKMERPEPQQVLQHAEALAKDPDAHQQEFDLAQGELRKIDEFTAWYLNYGADQGLESLDEARMYRDAAELLNDDGYFLVPYGEIKRVVLTARDEYAQVGYDTALTFAYVTTDGEWVQKAQMGWWGFTSDPNREYGKQFWAWIDSLPDDQYLMVVDCHI